ncbi:carboxymuconolactone decarboxylase family protein [Amycolatopsis jiangsuensis]|uniref:Alkylhydroperoxidase family enzyme n=1 Tax=Amycolatopsis jiangsuensis TaxID=1181879 RepID=A0A840J2K6_9PSEU|nr:carboxymuconolactone decarboxylase family protein [Amycolatopsis jiangsuensis]MBB4687648.1 alkylhydroperoxidase family enzyme [Amycolatopsis jiangsuensis]
MPAPIDLSPLPPCDWSPQLRDLLGAALRDHDLVDQPVSGPGQLNSVATLAHHPRLAIAFGQLVGSLSAGELSARDREVVILRSAYLTQSTYEWSHHRPLALRAGLSEAEVQRLGSDPIDDEWPAREKALLSAVDELHHRSALSTTTGRELAEHYRPRQLLELVFLAGCYRTVATLLNSCEVPLDSGVEALSPPVRR